MRIINTLMCTCLHLKSTVPFPMCIILLTTAFSALPYHSKAQYYPQAKAVSAGRLNSLLSHLKTHQTGPSEISTLNSLAALYLYLPLKNKSDIKQAVQYAERSLQASSRTKRTDGIPDALMILNECYFYQDKIDKSKALVFQVKGETRAKLLLQLAIFEFNISFKTDNIDGFDNCIRYAGDALLICEQFKLEDLALMAKRTIGLAKACRRAPGAEKYLLSLERLHTKKHAEGIRYINFSLCLATLLTDNKDRSYSYIQTALEQANSSKDTLLLGDIHYLKSIIYYTQERYREVITECRLALKFYSHSPGIYTIRNASVHTYIATAYNKLGEAKTALAYLNAAIKKYPPANHLDSLEYLERLGHSNRELKNYGIAEFYFKQRLKQNERLGGDPTDDRLNLGQVYVESHSYIKARSLLYKVLYSKKYQYLANGRKRHFHYMLFLADSASGHYLSAIKHQNYLNDQTKAEASLEKEKLIEKLKIQYRTKERENEVRLKTQNIKLLRRGILDGQERLRQSQRILMLVIGAIILLLTILGLVLILYRQNRLNNRRTLAKSKLLEKLLKEKEWLLKEIHHRVKNNMHIIFCLLESQARMADPVGRLALEKSKVRVYAMSLFHQKIYLSNDLEKMDFGLYVEELLIFLSDTFDLETRLIKMSHHIARVSLPVKLGMVLALVTNEIITNAVKYAFEGKKSGLINISLSEEEKGYTLLIRDNGSGINRKKLHLGKSLGMDLIHGLCADIGATVEFTSNSGTWVYIRFDIDNDYPSEEIYKGYEKESFNS